MSRHFEPCQLADVRFGWHQVTAWKCTVTVSMGLPRLCLQHPLMLKNYDELADASEARRWQRSPHGMPWLEGVDARLKALACCSGNGDDKYAYK